MELDHGLGMTTEMRAELAELRDAARDAEHTKQVWDELAKRGVLVPDTHSKTGVSTVKVDEVRARAAGLPAPFRRKVNTALDVIVERSQGLIDVAVDLELFEFDRKPVSPMSYSPRLMKFRRDAEGAEALCRAGRRVLDAVDEMPELTSVELAAEDILRSRRDAELEAGVTPPSPAT